MSVLYDDVQVDQYISAVTLKISLTEDHHWINHQTYGLF